MAVAAVAIWISRRIAARLASQAVSPGKTTALAAA
jgi:hypothetical protein